MLYRRLGRTGLEVSALALGTVELGLDYGIPAPGHYGRPSATEGVRLVHAALDAGINFIDTARGYGGSEAVLGQALTGRRDRVILATKVARPADNPTGAALRQAMLASLDESLSALGTDYVDVWQIHNADAALLAEADTLRAVFTDVRAAGKARWFGASTYGRTDPLLALQTGLFDILQVAYSVIDQRLADEVFAAAVAAGAGLLIRSVLLKGVLTDRAEHLPDRLSRLRDASRAFRGVAEQITPAVTPAQAAIAFALAHPQLSAILIGVRTIAELNENLAALNVSLPPETLNRLRHLRVDDDDLVNPATWNMP